MIRIKYKVMTSDHDGYCSDGECVYDEDYKKITVRLPKPDIYDGGSYYCELSDEVKAHGLGRHEAKFELVDVELINEQ
jgi:hypothetical protein